MTNEIVIAYLDNYTQDKLYVNQANNGGKYMTVVAESKDIGEIDVSPKVKLAMQAYCVDEKRDISSYKLIKFKNGKEESSMLLSSFDLDKIRIFNKLISSIDLSSASPQRIEFGGNLDVDSFVAALSQESRNALISVFEHSEDLKKDIIAIHKRKESLATFKRLLEDNSYWESYRDILKLPSAKEEHVWQKFLEKNQWIFGYGLEYKFNIILQKEAHLSGEQVNGSGSVISDFLLNDGHFLTIVELKKPSTELFNNKKNRSESWCISSELIYSYSQILTQKAAAQVEFSDNNLRYDKAGGIIEQYAPDPKTFLIIGSWKQIENDTPQEKKIKKKTLELFRRDSRNIEILTYDELFRRASHIVDFLDDSESC